MTPTARIKADPYVVGDLARAESALQELAELTRAHRAVTDNLSAAVDGLKEKAKAEAAPLEARKKEISDALAVFLKMNRDTLLKDRKSLELTFGFIGFRASTSICQMRGITAEMSLDRLKNGGFGEGVRIKEELDKDALRGWPEDRLALVGLMRVQKDQFFAELKEETLQPGAA